MHFAFLKDTLFQRQFHKCICVQQVGKVAGAMALHGCGMYMTVLAKLQFYLREILQCRAEIYVLIQLCKDSGFCNTQRSFQPW